MFDVATIVLLTALLSLLAQVVNIVAILTVRSRVELVHIATNSMKDQLVEATRLSAMAIGRDIGIAQERQDTADKLAAVKLAG